MSWVSVNRFFKTDKNRAGVMDVVDKVQKQWEEVALDLGYDPKENINVEEGDQMINISISEELDETMRTEPGDWW
jgi:GTP cyclohydrolase I